MAITLNDYQLIKVIHAGINTVIYRGYRHCQENSVIIKTLKSEYPSIQEIGRLKHEYKILKNLNITVIVKPIALENYQNGLALILEDWKGISLKHFIEQSDLETCLEMLKSTGKIYHFSIDQLDLVLKKRKL